MINHMKDIYMMDKQAWRDFFARLKDEVNDSFDILDFDDMSELWDFLAEGNKSGVYIIRNNYNTKIFVDSSLSLETQIRKYIKEDGTPTDDAPVKLRRDYRYHKNTRKCDDFRLGVAVVILEEELHKVSKNIFIKAYGAKKWGYNS